MSGILEEKSKDLYDQILQNPDYFTSHSILSQSLLAKLAKETIIKCHYCSKQIKQFRLIYQGKHFYCIVCFSHIILENKQQYLVLNLSKKSQYQSSLCLAQQLKIVNNISQYGIEHQRVRNIDLQALSIFKNNLRQKKQKQSMENHIEMSKQQKKANILFNEYSINDFMIAFMHEKTNPQLKNFIIQRKYLQQKQKEEMLEDVEKICKSQNDQAEIDQQSELSIDYDKINIDTKGIINSGKILLKKIELLKEKNDSKQKKISKVTKSNRLILQAKTGSHTAVATKMKRNRFTISTKK